MEQTALVMGSVLLFVALAAVMVRTRRVDWYRLSSGLRGADEGPAAGQDHGHAI